MIYKYFVSYTNHTNGNVSGYGRVEITRGSKVKSIEDIADMEKLISKKYGYEQVLIHNYILLSKKIGRWEN